MGKVTSSSSLKFDIFYGVSKNNRQAAIKNGKIGIAKLTS
jgi:hypothetical protein